MILLTYSQLLCSLCCSLSARQQYPLQTNAPFALNRILSNQFAAEIAKAKCKPLTRNVYWMNKTVHSKQVSLFTPYEKQVR